MTGVVHQHKSLRALFGVLVALVLMARLLAPAGFMPVMTSQGMMVTLCTGQGAVKVAVADDDLPQSRIAKGKGNHDEGGSASDHCPFAAAAALPALPVQDVVAILPVWHLPTGPTAFALRTGWIARLAAPPPPASGPPSHLD